MLFWDNCRLKWSWNCKKCYKEIPCKLTQFPSKVVSYYSTVSQPGYLHLSRRTILLLQGYLMLPYLCSQTLCTLAPSLNPGNYGFVFHFYILVISRKLYKWNHTLWNLLDPLLKFSLIPSRSNKLVSLPIVHSFFLLLSIIP